MSEVPLQAISLGERTLRTDVALVPAPPPEREFFIDNLLV